jgi:hypothetical protein
LRPAPLLLLLPAADSCGLLVLLKQRLLCLDVHESWQ